MSKAEQTVKDTKAASPTYSETATQPLPENDAPPSNYTLFLRDTVIYRTEYISLVLGPQYEATKPQPKPLFYVSVHMEKRFTNKSHIPQIRLHYGPGETYPVIGTVNFRASTTSDVTIWQDAKPGGIEASKNGVKDNAARRTDIELVRSGQVLNDVHSFYHSVLSSDGSSTREKFEWRHSGDPEVKALATENHPGEDISQQDRGLKLVKASSGQMLAVFAGGKHQKKLNPRRVAGKLRFVGEEILDPLIIVMTILSIIERGRRSAVKSANSSSPFSFESCAIS